MDPDAVSSDFAARLRQMGVVQPQPTFSPTSTASPTPSAPSVQNLGPSYPSPANNTTLTVLEARRKLQELAELDFEAIGRRGSLGREFLDTKTVLRLLKMRESGASDSDIEAQLDLRNGIVAKLGRPGVTTLVRQ